jgi:acyl-coenzyme A thioesterase 13
VAKTVFEFQVKSNHTNGMKNLHGGCCATLFDWCTTTALVLVSKKGFWRFKGVSRTLNVTYLRPVPEGEVVLIESELVHAGKNLCMPIALSSLRIKTDKHTGTLKGVMKRKSDGAILAMCEHGKVNIDPDATSKL